MRIAYFGLPLGALLLVADGHEIVRAAISRPEMPGMRRLSRLLAGKVWRKPNLDAPRWAEALRRDQPDLIVSWFWTKRIPTNVLAIAPGFGVHPSLLPRHRGPDPYFWAIYAGDAETGVTAHRLAAEYDTGAILAQARLAIDPTWNAWQLARALDRPSLRLLRSVASAYARGAVKETPQDESQVTLAPAPTDEDLALRFDAQTDRVLRHIRAAAPWPGASVEIGHHLVTVTRAARAHHFPAVLSPGEAAVVNGCAVVRTQDGAIELLEGELEGPAAGEPQEQSATPLGPRDFMALVERARRDL